MNRLLVITGPTASGKTELSIYIAKKINGEIISADSRQIFQGMKIATSSPDDSQKQNITHHLLEFLKPYQEYNAGKFGKDSRKIIDELFKKNIQPILVGGSGLYIKSCIDGLFEGNSSDSEIRKRLFEELDKFGKDYMYNKLKTIDPESASKMTSAYYRRVIRALEAYYVTGKKISELQSEKPQINFESFQIGLSLDRKYLYEKINKRVELMIENGLIEEVKKLKSKGYHYETHNSLNTVGIKEVFLFLENNISFEDMVELIKRNTRRFAKRQITWFKKDKRINWIDINKNTNFEYIADKCIKLFYDNFRK